MQKNPVRDRQWHCSSRAAVVGSLILRRITTCRISDAYLFRAKGLLKRDKISEISNLGDQERRTRPLAGRGAAIWSTSKSPTASHGGVRDTMFRNSALTVTLLLSFLHVSSAVPNRGKTYSASLRKHRRASHHNIDNLRGGAIDKVDITSIDVSTMTTGEGEDEKICIIGSGNWGCAIATVLGRNAARLPFCNDEVSMWVFDEEVTLPVDKTTAKLSDVMNTLHENIKYLPGVTLPSNVRAIPDLKEACKNATLVRKYPSFFASFAASCSSSSSSYSSRPLSSSAQSLCS